MAVLPMQHVNLYGLKKERKKLLELLQRRGVVELCDGLEEDNVFHKEDVSREKRLLEEHISLVEEALRVIEPYYTEKKSVLNILKGRKTISPETYEGFYNKYDMFVEDAQQIVTLKKELEKNKVEILKFKGWQEMLLPWMPLDIPMDFSGTKSVASFIGTLPGFWSVKGIEEQLEGVIPCHVQVISSSVEQTCICVLCPKNNKDNVFDSLRGIGFSYPDFVFNKTPKLQIEDLECLIANIAEEIIRIEAKIKGFVKLKQAFLFLEDYNRMRIQKYGVIGNLLQSNHVFVMTGYIPKVKCDAIYKEFNSKFQVLIEFEVPNPEEDVPVLLQNNGFSTPLESTVESFSYPGKHETDPTMVMSLFYYLLFGLMLSDAAYGVIMVMLCGIGLVKFKDHLEQPMRNTLKMFLFCGISTIFWGIMFGSYFGDIVDVVSKTFFGYKVTIPALWFVPVNAPMRMLVFSMLLGVIHLYTGLGMKLYCCIKQKDYKAVLYDILMWYVLLTSSIMILLAMPLFVDTLGLDFLLPESLGQAAKVLALASAIGITLTNGRESKNPFKRFLKGLYALYGITGYLSDVLSYSRLLALGLATGVICTVINKMASMVAEGPIGVVLFIIIFIVGHSLNIAINALGAYVHTNRLQYVEFFGKFYEGGGRKFNPFGIQTKYYKFKEEMKNG